jgi:hypothetical protein
MEEDDIIIDNDVDKEEETLRIYLTDLQGDQYEMTVKQSEKVETMIKYYRDLKGINQGQSSVKLVYKGVNMDCTKEISNYNIEDDDFIHVLVRFKGGNK